MTYIPTVFAVSGVLEEGAHMAQHTWLSGLATMIFLTVFVAWTVWTWAPSRRAQMDAAAQLPFDDDGGAQ
ncbi:MAG: cbb3-type cytochrome oxidase subunit 3 [Kiritimatiellia bacterium]|jgi:cbb3-type cytochrome oxidase subunit 3